MFLKTIFLQFMLLIITCFNNSIIKAYCKVNNKSNKKISYFCPTFPNKKGIIFFNN